MVGVTSAQRKLVLANLKRRGMFLGELQLASEGVLGGRKLPAFPKSDESDSGTEDESRRK